METLFENGSVLVRRNSANEIFYQNKRSGVELRIGDYNDRTTLTASGANWMPSSVGGLPAMVFTKPK